MFDPTVDFTPEELEIINASYVTVPELREFWAKYPELTLEAAIGGVKGLEEMEARGCEPADPASPQENPSVEQDPISPEQEAD